MIETETGAGLQGSASALPVPDSVAILGLGPSLHEYLDVATRLGSRRSMFDEVWGINQAVNVINCDRGFHMDDVRVQESRAIYLAGQEAEAVKQLNEPSAAGLAPDQIDKLTKQAIPNNIGPMLTWLRTHPGPIYTSVPHSDYPGLIAYPLADVMNSCGRVAYFNSTAAYAVAFAVHLGVKKIYLFGCDFSYPNAHQSEQGRACVEFYLGIHKARGGVIGLPNTSLMDGTATNGARLYGYDGMDVAFSEDETGPLRVEFTPRALPTAAEIEARYDHSQHPNPMVRT
jgi:hypothetical protein